MCFVAKYRACLEGESLDSWRGCEVCRQRERPLNAGEVKLVGSAVQGFSIPTGVLSVRMD